MAAHAANSPERGAHGPLLVIDDKVLVRDAIQLILKQRGHHVVAAECGQRGVEAIEAHAFDAVIVDIFMPGMDGFQTIRILHRSAPKTAIIAISGAVETSIAALRFEEETAHGPEVFASDCANAAGQA